MGVYLQDQVALTPYLQLIAGARLERFDLTFHNFRNGEDIDRQDDLVSPRAGVVVKPVEPLSLYGSYGVSYLPSAGDQFSSLTATSETLEPEKFENYEVGGQAGRGDRALARRRGVSAGPDNTSAPDPVDPSRTIQTGSQRTKGFEFGRHGQPDLAVAGGRGLCQPGRLHHQPDLAGRRRAPRSRWCRATPSRCGTSTSCTGAGVSGLGVIYQDQMFAAIDNAVTLPSFTRVDAAAYFTLTRELRAQVNVENVFDKRYFITSHSNNNISPGSPRAVRVGVTAGL